MRLLASMLIAVSVVALADTGCSRRSVRRAERRWERVAGQPDHAVNLNTASREELASLPGLSDDDADRIIAHRPYNEVQGLLRKKVIGKSKFEQIQDLVYVRR
jgi:radical SAM superfamily enzyme with C-terminal helix-hairpin-helix motif